MDVQQILDSLQQFVVDYGLQVVGALLTLIIGFWLAGWLTRLAKRAMERRNLDPTIRPFLASMLNVGLKVLVLLTVAGMFGIETTSFIAIFSALAFAVGLALQGNLGHFASGILILVFKPFRVGEFIVTQGYSGTVKEIQVFHTLLTTLDNRIIIIPNGAITSGPIENLTSPGERKVDMTFGIGYPDDIDKARSVIDQVIQNTPNVMLDKGYDILVKELGDSSVNFAVRVWCKVEDYWGIYFHMQENVKKEFDKAGVGIPFPQMDVHLFRSES
jgi:small conductance mechanosensitive channel